MDGNGPAGQWPPAEGQEGQFNPEDHATSQDYDNYDFLQEDHDNMEEDLQTRRTEEEAAPELEDFQAQTAEYQRQLAALAAQENPAAQANSC